MTTVPIHPLLHLLLAALALATVLACASPGEPPPPPTATTTTAPALRPTADAAGAADPAPPSDPPAAPGALAPSLAASADGVWLSWLESEGEGDGHRLQAARWDGEAWGAPVTIARGERFFANWADTPSLAEDGAGHLLAHWLERTGDAPYAYGVRIARSTDGGITWNDLGFLHDDASPTEHGFVTLVPAGRGGGFEAVWLDGRQTAAGGAMTLRTAVLPAGGEGPLGATVLDERVCDCCQTDAARTAGGLLVVYRDRSQDEVRDIAAARRTGSGWQAPQPVARDGWTIAGCPVNGPAVAAAGDRAAVAWFTAADDRPRVQVAFSDDGGAAFAPPLPVDADAPLGRVDAALAADGSAVVSWLAAGGEVRVQRFTPQGAAGEAVPVGTTTVARASGFPRLLLREGRLHVAWVEAGRGEAPGRLRFTALARP
ncbi:MAG TPA: hypothetical protein VHQ65_06380 [Thermoanaerobaculia bacterium]|nr:hypothetical protein [Thermoanaerobaculia bacterium]